MTEANILDMDKSQKRIGVKNPGKLENTTIICRPTKIQKLIII